MKIFAIDAINIRIYFDRLKLEKDAELYIYNPEGTVITGPITSSENLTNNLWGSNRFPGSTAILELKVASINRNSIEVHISSILYGYKLNTYLNILNDSTNNAYGFGSASSCTKNIMCPEANGWDVERRGIALVEAPTGEEGTGFLVNNTCNNYRPYLITAWHGTTGKSTTNWQFIFGYWSATCSPNQDGSKALLFNGSTKRVEYEPTDMALLELTQTPPSNSNITYLGWSRASTAPSSSVGISHPWGDVMKFAKDTDPAVIGNIRTNVGTAWRVNWKIGMTQPGSSGSPHFDPNHRVIGVLYSSSQSPFPPCNPVTGGTNFGRFDLSWNGGGTPATRLKDWLDPNGINPTTLNTISVTPLAITGDFSTWCAYSTRNFSVTATPNTTYTWSVNGKLYISGGQGTNQITLGPGYTGAGVISLTRNICGFASTENANITVAAAGVGGTVRQNGQSNKEMNTVNFIKAGYADVDLILPGTTSIGCSRTSGTGSWSYNPANDYVTITAVKDESSPEGKMAKDEDLNYEVSVYNVSQVLVAKSRNIKGQKQIKLNIGGLRTGVYFIIINNGKHVSHQQLLIQ